MNRSKTVLKALLGISFILGLMACASSGGTEQAAAPSPTPPSVEVETKIVGRVTMLPPTKDCNNALVNITSQEEFKEFGPAEIETVAQRIKKGLEEKGYKIVEAAAEADYVILGTLVFAGDADPEYLKAMYRSGYGTQRVEREKKRDLIASSVGFMTDKVRARSYGLVIDYSIDSSQRTKTGVMRQKSRCRIVAGVPSSRKTFEEVNPSMKESMAANFLQLL